MKNSEYIVIGDSTKRAGGEKNPPAFLIYSSNGYLIIFFGSRALSSSSLVRMPFSRTMS